MHRIQPPQYNKPKKDAKKFLSELVPRLLSAVNIQSTQSFLGIKVNIEVEARNRIERMTESQAERALNALKVELEKWN